jgi:hypothetical protein
MPYSYPYRCEDWQNININLANTVKQATALLELEIIKSPDSELYLGPIEILKSETKLASNLNHFLKLDNTQRNYISLKTDFTTPTDIDIKVADPLGKILVNKSYTKQEKGQIDIPLDNISSGMYLVYTFANNQRNVYKIIVY